MGYKRPARIYTIVDWPDEDMAGLEVKARSVKLKKFIEFGRLMSNAKAASAEDAEEAITNLVSFFAKALVSWNLEDDDGAPVPATYDGLIEQDNDFVMRIIFAWMQIVGGAPGPLGKPSTDGETSLVASLPMEPLSTSQAS